MKGHDLPGEDMRLSTIFHPSRIATLALAATGALVFHWLGLPLPLLLGPMFACLLAALAGMPMKGVPPVSDAMRPILGVAAGASITPALFGQMAEMALSIALIPPFILVITLTGYPYFRKLWGYDHATSYYGAMPGGLQDMVLFGEAAGADVRALSLIHTTRVLIIVSAVPFLVTLIWGLPLTGPPGSPASELPLDQGILMVAAAIVGWWAGERLGLFGAPILGPLIVAALASLSGLLTARPPAEAMEFAQFFLGLGIGVKYSGITMAEVKRVLTASFGYCVLLALITIAFAEIVIQTNLAPPLEALMAFAPGGQAEMLLLALIAGADMAFVVTHHVLRIVVVILGAPLAARIFDR